MIVLSALISALRSRGILDDAQVAEIKDLHMLSFALQKRLPVLCTEEEQVYLREVNRLIEEKKMDELLTLKVPETMHRFDEALHRSWHLIKDHAEKL